MRCPTCIAANERSRVFPGGMASTSAMIVDEFWDEDGAHHYHDPNMRGRTYTCSIGHRWNESRQNPCPAGDWPKAEA